MSIDNPYERGISAFCVRGDIAIYAELTGVENFRDDVQTVLVPFLENSNYGDV